MFCMHNSVKCFLLPSLLLCSLLFSLSFGDDSYFSTFQVTPTSGEHLASLGAKRLLADGLGDDYLYSSSLVLAEGRTYRKDPLDGFKKYTGGWNISEKHYWASVSYTAAPIFVIAGIWFLVFGVCLLAICLFHFCCPKPPYGYSRTAYACSLIFLILFTVTAIIGCIILYIGQGRYYVSTTNTLKYVEDQADTTAQSLKDVSMYLGSAKNIDMINNISLPGNVQTDITEIQNKIDSSASNLATQTSDNSDDIKHLIESVRLALIILAAVMLSMTFLGFVFSLFGMQSFVYSLVVTSWILVTGTFILCGIFLLLHNVTGDTCVAMNEWVQNPVPHTALDDIIPCVDNATAQETLNRTKEVSSQLVELINEVITNVSNINFAPAFVPFYYNQSGPLLPILCDPFNPDLTDRTCSSGEVDLTNATQVWSNFVCQVSPTGVCITPGRLTPTLYNQFASTVNVSYGLNHYGSFLVSLQDCTFVRETFSNVHANYCPGLRKYSRWIYAGLLVVSCSVMLSILLWVIYGRERKHRTYTKEHMPRPVNDSTEEK
ncbi:hypothetical protein LIER_10159 [Lithospermum erythrorhizon]|uniref:Transmembrane protein n=1 Tax=Lithospermum erythrorhizon TaxID=34254 RepID=A0AAV3PJY4_LITER